MRAKNMQTLTDNVKAKHPGVTIWGIGDDEHKTRISDHNEDDTPGSKAEQSDSDNIPEHRAIDVMIGPKFTKANANDLVSALVNNSANKARLNYVIFDGYIWSKSNGFKKTAFDGDPHRDHPHVSGLASDDNNTANWVLSGGSPTPPPANPPASNTLQKGSSGAAVKKLQNFFRDVFPAYRGTVTVKRGQMLAADGEFGPQTQAWVIEFQKRTGLDRDGIVGSKTTAKLRSYGYKP